jgi:hypothetical protein
MAKKKVLNQAGDLVLVHYEDQPVVYARIEAIEPDIKKDWLQVSLLILTIPLQAVTWILREEYINGEGFTMGGKAMKMERVESPVSSRTPEDGGLPSGTKGPEKPSKVLAFKKQH